MVTGPTTFSKLTRKTYRFGQGSSREATHMDRGIDPYDVSSDEYGDLVENRILMAVDKYQAAVARSQKAHDEAMDIVKGTLFPKYRNDVIMNRVLTAVDAVGKEETLFAEAA